VIDTDKIYYVVAKLYAWEEITLEYVGHNPGIPVSLAKPENGEVGFLPVYDTYEQAIKEAGSSDLVLPIRRVSK